MRTMTAEEARRRFGALMKAAEADFVTITRHGKRRYVLMPAWAYDGYEKIREAQVMNRVLLTAETAAAKILADDPAQWKILRESSSLMRQFLKEVRPRF